MGPHPQLLLPFAPGCQGPPLPGATHLTAVELCVRAACRSAGAEETRRDRVDAVPAADFRERLFGAAETGGGTPTHSREVLKGLECLSPDPALDSVSMGVGRPLRNC